MNNEVGVPAEASGETVHIKQYMSERPKVGTAVIVRKDGRVLLGKRRSPHASGTWGSPGGHLELGEEIEAAILREVEEEVGIKLTNLARGPYTNDIFPDGKHYVTLFFTADYDSGEVRVKEPDKFENWEWFEWRQLPEPLMLPIRNLLAQDFDPFAPR